MNEDTYDEQQTTSSLLGELQTSEKKQEQELFRTILKKTLRVPTDGGWQGEGTQVTRQLDITLMQVGFKLSRELFTYYTQKDPILVVQQGSMILEVVRELVGDHIKHNVYFKAFPSGVPNTREFWMTEILRLFFTGETQYGTYQHTYEEMLALHDEFLPKASERVTVIHKGATLMEEITALYYQLASSPVPLNEADRALVKEITEVSGQSITLDCAIPVRETKALINAVRLKQGQSLIVDTPTDILRVMAELSGGDVTLTSPTRFRSLPRAQRRKLLEALDDLVRREPSMLEDVNAYREEWKRVGERLHPHEEQQYDYALNVFEVARGERKSPTLASRVEASFRAGELERVIRLLSNKPGILVRSMDRVLRTVDEEENRVLVERFRAILPHVSGRVLLSLREHLQNRAVQQERRIFTNRRGKAWVSNQGVAPLPQESVSSISLLIDSEIEKRLPALGHLVVNSDVLGVALPLSEKQKSEGFAIQPRGSKAPMSGLVRFFLYWKQAQRRTDYDLSAILLNEHFDMVSQLSYTNLQALGGVHGGDLTHAEDGASEFIDLDLDQVPGSYIIPQVNIFVGEDFTQVDECFFGVMQRDLSQHGKPFEPRTVQFKSDIRGDGKVALPLVFRREKDTQWTAIWTHMYLKGMPHFNRVEGNHLTTSMLTQAIVERQYLDVQYLVMLLGPKARRCSFYKPSMQFEDDKKVTYIGLERPEGLPEGSKVYTLANLKELIPD